MTETVKPARWYGDNTAHVVRPARNPKTIGNRQSASMLARKDVPINLAPMPEALQKDSKNG